MKCLCDHPGFATLGVVTLVLRQVLHGAQPRVGSQGQAELSLTSTSGRLTVGLSQQREFARFSGSNFSVKSFSEDRPLLTSVVGEAGTEVCVPKVNEKSYSSTKDQQETAEGKILQAPTWLVAQSKALSRAIRGGKEVKGQTKTGGSEPPV